MSFNPDQLYSEKLSKRLYTMQNCAFKFILIVFGIIAAIFYFTFWILVLW